MESFEIDKRSGQLFVRKGATLDVNHLNGESIVFSVEVNEMIQMTF
jgi:FKBP-type peptidyl-prolyl cis-trans isomerase 2